MSKKQPKLTTPFPRSVRPAYIGGYLYTYSNGYEFYAWWDGRRWIVNDNKYPGCIGMVIKNFGPRDTWRGLATNPARSKT